MPTLPFIQVKDLAPSASFYSAVLQPLGLRFLSANSSSIVFGNPNPVFEVKAASSYSHAPRPTRLILSVGSSNIVSAFHAAAKRANPDGDSNLIVEGSDGRNTDSRASASDLEGNIVEVRHTHSARKEIRVIDWDIDVHHSGGAARSVSGSSTQSRPSLASMLLPTEEEAYKILRSLSTRSSGDGPYRPSHNPKSLSTSSVLGTVLGAVAAGAAVGAGLTYALSRREHDFSPYSDYDGSSRRATYGDASADSHQNRYIEMERTVEKLRYPDSPEFTPPAYGTRTSRQDSLTVDDLFDDDGRHHRLSSRTRGRSSSSTTRTPLMITDADHKSSVTSHTIEPPRVSAPSRHHSPTRSPHHSPKGSRSHLHVDLTGHHHHHSRSRSPHRSENGKAKSHTELPIHHRHSHSHSHSHAGSKVPTKVHSPSPHHGSSRSKHEEHRHHAPSRSKHDDEHHDHRSHVSRSKHESEHRTHISRAKHEDDHRSQVSHSHSKHESDRHSHASSRPNTHTRSRRDLIEDETISYVSTRSEKSTHTARPTKPRMEPSSRSSSASVGGVPLLKTTPPEPTVEDSPPSPREIPLPPSPMPGRGHGMSRYAPRQGHWREDDRESVAPSDSISCVEERPRPHARDIPFLQGRERLIIQ